MNRYLIVYGENNEMATFQADNADHAVEQFCDWAPVSPDYVVNKTSVNEVLLCTPVEWME